MPNSDHRFTDGLLRFTFGTMMRSTSILLATLFTVVLSSNLLAQEGWRLQGKVLDATTDGGLPGAAVFLDGQGALTDVDGRFSFSGDGSGAKVLRVRYVGYIETTQTLDAWQGDRTEEIRLELGLDWDAIARLKKEGAIN